jgi:hypothetical protein
MFRCGLVGESALATVEFMGCMTGKGTSHKEKDIGKTGEHREGMHLHRASSAFGYSLYIPQWLVGGVTCGCRNQRKTVCIGAFKPSVSPIVTKLDGTHVIHLHVKRCRASPTLSGVIQSWVRLRSRGCLAERRIVSPRNWRGRFPCPPPCNPFFV